MPFFLKPYGKQLAEGIMDLIGRYSGYEDGINYCILRFNILKRGEIGKIMVVLYDAAHIADNYKKKLNVDPKRGWITVMNRDAPGWFLPLWRYVNKVPEQLNLIGRQINTVKFKEEFEKLRAQIRTVKDIRLEAGAYLYWR